MIKNKRIHLIGIGGISMSALAKYLMNNNYVQGSDLKQNNEIIELVDKGIPVFIGHDKKHLKDIDIVVYSGAIDTKNEELNYAINNNITVLERSKLLGLVSNDFDNTIAIAGTHGKTTTTAMISKVFIDYNLCPTIHIGGDYNYIGGNFKNGKKQYFITEACEYKKSFLELHPQFAIINNVELDHTDCYKSQKELYDTFIQFINQTKVKAFVYSDDKFCELVKNNDKIITYGFNKNAEYRAFNLRNNNSKYTFDISFNGEYIATIKLNIEGKYNVINALACTALCHTLNIPCEKIKQSLETFKNVARRFEFIKKINNADIYGDYAHHPTEIKNLLSNVKSLSYDKVIVYFQPHTYTRTKDLFNDFLKCFNDCDELYLVPTYSAREEIIMGGRSEDLFNTLSKTKQNVYFINSLNDCYKSIELNSNGHNLVLLVGAGDIGNIFDATQKAY